MHIFVSEYKKYLGFRRNKKNRQSLLLKGYFFFIKVLLITTSLFKFYEHCLSDLFVLSEFVPCCRISHKKFGVFFYSVLQKKWGNSFSFGTVKSLKILRDNSGNISRMYHTKILHFYLEIFCKLLFKKLVLDKKYLLLKVI